MCCLRLQIRKTEFNENFAWCVIFRETHLIDIITSSSPEQCWVSVIARGRKEKFCLNIGRIWYKQTSMLQVLVMNHHFIILIHTLKKKKPLLQWLIKYTRNSMPWFAWSWIDSPITVEELELNVLGYKFGRFYMNRIHLTFSSYYSVMNYVAQYSNHTT